MKNKPELIPVSEVISDMWSDDPMIASAAKSYYYAHYASDDEKKMMNKLDKRNALICKLVWVGLFLLITILYITDI